MFRLPAFGWMIMMMMKMAMMTILMKMVIVMTVLIMTLCFDAFFLGSLFHLCISLLLILHPVHHANCISEFDSFIILLLIIIHVLSIGNKVYISSLHFNNPPIQIQINISPCLSNSWNPWCPIPKLFQQCLFVTIITMTRKIITKLGWFFISLIQQW